MDQKASRLLGIAFLLQFVTSFSSGVFLKSAWFVPDNFGETMRNIAMNPALFRGNILLDTFTALGVTFLGAMLFLTLRKQNEKLALTALAFYILEGTLLAVSRMNAFALLRLSEEYVAAGQPANVLLAGQIAYEAMEFAGNTLHMLAFCLGALLFYFLFYRSRVIPAALSLWGLITTLPMLVGTITQIFGHTLPIIFYVPYVSFELVIGIWILVRA